MTRTTIMADDALLDDLRRIAEIEGVSLGEVMRQGFEWRARARRRPPQLLLPPESPRPPFGERGNWIGIAASTDGVSDASRRVDEILGEHLDEKFPRH